MSMDATTLLSSQIGAAAACAYIIQRMKDSPRLGWITPYTDTVSKVVRAAFALVATVGITWVWAAGATAGAHVLSINIPSVSDLGHGAWHWFTQYALTHFAGKIAGIPSAPPKPADV
jgi:hypothetical protein